MIKINENGVTAIVYVCVFVVALVSRSSTVVYVYVRELGSTFAKT